MIASVLIIGLITAVIYIASHRLSGLQVLAVCFVFIIGVILVAFPELASVAATRAGVGRGSDLILYLCVIAGIFAATNLYFRSRNAERRLANLVQELALMEGKLDQRQTQRDAGA